MVIFEDNFLNFGEFVSIKDKKLGKMIYKLVYTEDTILIGVFRLFINIGEVLIHYYFSVVADSEMIRGELEKMDEMVETVVGLI